MNLQNVLNYHNINAIKGPIVNIILIRTDNSLTYHDVMIINFRVNINAIERPLVNIILVRTDRCLTGEESRAVNPR